MFCSPGLFPSPPPSLTTDKISTKIRRGRINEEIKMKEVVVRIKRDYETTSKTRARVRQRWLTRKKTSSFTLFVRCTKGVRSKSHGGKRKEKGK